MELDMSAYRAMTPEEKIQTLTHWHEVAADAIERQYAEVLRLRGVMEEAVKVLRARPEEWAKSLACVVEAELAMRGSRECTS